MKTDTHLRRQIIDNKVNISSENHCLAFNATMLVELLKKMGSLVQKSDPYGMDK